MELLSRCQYLLSEERVFEMDMGFHRSHVEWVLNNAGLDNRVNIVQCEAVTGASFQGENATDTDVFVFVRTEGEETHLLEEVVCAITGDEFQLRFLSKTKEHIRGSRLGWTGKVFARHGGCFPSWWEKDRTRITLPLDGDALSFNDVKDWEVAVYVRVKKIDIDTIRNECMEYIGGQTFVQCQTHKIPLIIASPPLGKRRPEIKCYQVRL